MFQKPTAVEENGQGVSSPRSLPNAYSFPPDCFFLPKPLRIWFLISFTGLAPGAIALRFKGMKFLRRFCQFPILYAEPSVERHT